MAERVDIDENGLNYLLFLAISNINFAIFFYHFKLECCYILQICEDNETCFMYEGGC